MTININNGDDDFTTNLNDRIKELEDMTKQIDDQTQEREDQASKGMDITEEPRTEGDTIFFTAKVNSAEPLKLNVTNNNGDIHVTGSDVDQIEIKAVKQDGKNSDHADWFFQALENEITLRPNWNVSNQFGEIAGKLKSQLKDGFRAKDWGKKDFTFGMDVKYDLTVSVPKSLADASKVSIKTANGDIQVRELKAQVDAKTANGDVHVDAIDADVTANSANGDVEVSGITGKATSSTANGDVKLRGITGSVEGNTTNGDIDVDGVTGWIALRAVNGDAKVTNATMHGGRIATVAGDISVDAAFINEAAYTFDTVTGDVNVKATVPMSGATFSAKSLSGDISVGEGWTKTGKNAWTIGEGTGARISAKSVSSDLHVEARFDDNLHAMKQPKADDTQPFASEETASDLKRDNDVNINLDMELERAKTWMKDIGSKLGSLLGEMDARRTSSGSSDETIEIATPEAPQAPLEPQAPVSPASAERRARLLEAVKNGEMTVDEALAELDKA